MHPLLSTNKARYEKEIEEKVTASALQCFGNFTSALNAAEAHVVAEFYSPLHIQRGYCIVVYYYYIPMYVTAITLRPSDAVVAACAASFIRPGVQSTSAPNVFSILKRK